MAVALLVLGCTGGDSTTNPSDTQSTPNDSPGDTTRTTGMEGAHYVHIRDGNDVNHLDCQAVSTPGADIDAATLYKNPTKEIKARLSSCQWLDKGDVCSQNKQQDPTQAQGDPTKSPVTGFVSLNGGGILCEWSNSQALQLGNLIQVYEVGSALDAESIQIRACKDATATQCGPFQTIDQDAQLVPAGKLLWESPSR